MTNAELQEQYDECAYELQKRVDEVAALRATLSSILSIYLQPSEYEDVEVLRAAALCDWTPA